MKKHKNSAPAPVFRLFSKTQIFTLPNLLSLIRLLLIPLIIWLFCVPKNYTAASLVIILSSLTDILDGIVARKFNMVSDIGKILDPVVDKLTQIAIIICLSTRYPLMLALLVLFALRELCMLIMGAVTLSRTGAVNSAKWYGKLATVLLYTGMTLLIILPELSLSAANPIICVCGAAVLFSLAMYARFYLSLWLNPTKNYEYRQDKHEQTN